MKGSAKGRYGLQLMVDLALHAGRGPELVEAIARRQGLPPKFLRVLLGSLKDDGLIKVQRGPSGGCELAKHPSHITAALPQSFRYNSEQYYQLVDPGNVVLADALYEYDGRRCIMPTIWYKGWGKGRVFYSAMGHAAKEFVDFPHVLEMTARGILWAGEGKK